jgi:hypothetical protein
MSNYINNETIVTHYLDEKMIKYFQNKLKGLSKDTIILRSCEVIKFLYISNFSLGPVPFNQDLDDIWHLLVMQTKEYEQLMQKLPHKKFIHHNSYEYEPPEILSSAEEKIEKNRQVSYFVSYVHNFGPIAENVLEFYSTGLALFSMCNKDIDMLNKFLYDLGSKFKKVG